MKKQLSLLLLLLPAATFTVSAQNACSKQVDDKEVEIKVINKTNKPFTVNWVDHECKEGRSDQEVTPGETFAGISYNGHAFRVREVGTDKLLREIVVNSSSPVTTVTAPPAGDARPTQPPTSSAGIPVIKVFMNTPNAKPCTPEPGWDKCLELLDPTIKIMGTSAVTQSAMNGVANVYTEIAKRLGVKYLKSKLNNFKVYIDNGEPWSELRSLTAIAKRSEQPYETSDDYYRGFGGPDSLWITEQMICKKGVKSRNETGIKPDNETRTFDQVVHEFAHSIDFKYVPDQTINLFRGTIPPVELFAWNVQFWFGTPSASLELKHEAILKDLFTSRATFSCEGYKP